MKYCPNDHHEGVYNNDQYPKNHQRVLFHDDPYHNHNTKVKILMLQSKL